MPLAFSISRLKGLLLLNVLEIQTLNVGLLLFNFEIISSTTLVEQKQRLGTSFTSLAWYGRSYFMVLGIF